MFVHLLGAHITGLSKQLLYIAIVKPKLSLNRFFLSPQTPPHPKLFFVSMKVMAKIRLFCPNIANFVHKLNGLFALYLLSLSVCLPLCVCQSPTLSICQSPSLPISLHFCLSVRFCFCLFMSVCFFRSHGSHTYLYEY